MTQKRQIIFLGVLVAIAAVVWGSQWKKQTPSMQTMSTIENYKVLAVDVRKPTFPMHKTQFHRVDLTLPTADAELAAIWKREGVDTVVHAAFLSSPTHATFAVVPVSVCSSKNIAA